MLEAVRRVHVVEPGIDVFGDAVGITVLYVERNGTLEDWVTAAADINPVALEQSTFEVSPDSFRFGGLVQVIRTCFPSDSEVIRTCFPVSRV